jgi:EmrB/QacA subfamily drug resistance transporter
MRRSPWATLTVLALAQFIVVLDVTIVNVALPDIQSDLGFSADGLQWVISAYTLLFGGFLLLGGRAADLLGSRRVFVTGLALFGATSLLGGLAPSPGWLIAARAVQGLGGALLSPAALSILTVTFEHGRRRNIAMGVWGGLAGLGGTLGVVAGGLLVDSFSWRWVFIVNVPIVVALVAATPVFVRHITPHEGNRSFDLFGALLGTGGLLALVYGVVRAEPVGWSSAEVVGFLIAGAVMLAAFVMVEARTAAPLVPLRLLRSRALSTAGGALALNGAAFLSMFFLTAIFLQQVRGGSALRAGVEFLPMGGAAIVTAVLTTPLVTRFGTRPVQIVGAALNIAGLLLLAQAGAHGSYASHLLPGLVLFGTGIIALSVPAQIAAVADVSAHEAGRRVGCGHRLLPGRRRARPRGRLHAGHLPHDPRVRLRLVAGRRAGGRLPPRPAGGGGLHRRRHGGHPGLPAAGPHGRADRRGRGGGVAACGRLRLDRLRGAVAVTATQPRACGLLPARPGSRRPEPRRRVRSGLESNFEARPRGRLIVGGGELGVFAGGAVNERRDPWWTMTIRQDQAGPPTGSRCASSLPSTTPRRVPARCRRRCWARPPTTSSSATRCGSGMPRRASCANGSTRCT